MNFRNHEIGILILLLTLLPSWQYCAILVVVLFYKVMSRRGQIPKNSLYALQPLLLMIAVGMVFASNNLLYAALKDLWYLVKVLLIAMVGIMIGFKAQPSLKWLQITVFYSALAIFIELLIFGVATMSGQSAMLLPAFVPIFIAIFYLRSTSHKKTRDKMLCWLLGALVLAAILLSESRTTLLVTFIVWIGAAGYFQSKTKITLCAVALVAVAIVAVPQLPLYDPHNISFLGKVQNSLTELSFVAGDEMTSITANWRGFEALRAYKAWQTGSFGQQLFGQGLGATTDIGFYYNLSESYWVRYLPILHNGYFMVLVKYGVLGVALFVAFMAFPLFLRLRTSDPYSKLGQKMAVTASVVLLVTTLSITGPLNISKLDGITMIMGWALGVQFRMRLLNYAPVRKRTVNAGNASLPNRLYSVRGG